MANLKLRQKDLLKIGYPKGKVIGIAINKMLENYRRKNKVYVLGILSEVLEEPEQFLEDEILGAIARELTKEEEIQEEIQLLEQPKSYRAFGLEGIDDGAVRQLETAMQLPITEACLLYTSPSPRDLSTSRMPSSA